MTKLNYFIRENEYVVELVEIIPDETGHLEVSTIIHRKKVMPSPIKGSLQERQIVWILKTIKGEDIGEFPRA